MKKLFILIVIILLFAGCTPIIETEYIYLQIPDSTPDDVRLIAAWENNMLTWIFYDDGEFIYYKSDTFVIYNYGFYNADPITGIIYVEDYINGESATYAYAILNDFPSVGDITLRWDLGDWLKQVDF
jgi:hypothetical protein